MGDVSLGPKMKNRRRHATRHSGTKGNRPCQWPKSISMGWRREKSIQAYLPFASFVVNGDRRGDPVKRKLAQKAGMDANKKEKPNAAGGQR